MTVPSAVVMVPRLRAKSMRTTSTFSGRSLRASAPNTWMRFSITNTAM